ncbi:MAG TPA: hypothetical protein VJ652_00425 [Noviherbaspirillum sp.]|nr:hypothetical protein [Noviherbaspirillum sp.]
MIPTTGAMQRILPAMFLAGSLSALPGCSSLLPDARQETQTPWHSYAEAQAMFNNIIPGKTTLAELKALGIDHETTPNVTLLSHTDLLRRLVPSTSFDIKLLDPGLQQCVSAQAGCFAYEIEQVSLQRNRYGNFWLDFLNFRRQIDVSGWQLDAVVVIRKDTVVYKAWSGKPKVHQLENERNPLGPLQGLGPALIQR